MRFMSIRIMAALLLPVMLAGHSYGGPPINLADRGNMSGGSNTLSEAAALVQADKLNPAIQVYDGIIQHGRTTLEIHEAAYRKGLCLSDLKQFEPALACWQNLLDRYTTTAWNDDALLEMGKTYVLNLNQPEKALACYERLIREYPQSDRMMEIRYQFALATYMKGDYAKAKGILDGFLSTYPKSPLTQEAQDWLKRTEVALKASAKSTTRPALPKASPPHKAMVAVTTNATSELSKELAEAEELQQRANYVEAIKALQAIIKNNVAGQGYDRALFRLGQCYGTLNEDEKAIATWQEVVKRARRGQSSDYVDDCLLAQAETWLEKLGQADKASKCCQTLMTDYPRSPLIPKAEHVMGLVYYYQGAPERARTIFVKELKSMRLATNAPPNEIQRLIAACDRRPTASGAGAQATLAAARADQFIRLGDVLFAAMKYEQAAKAYDRVVKTAPDTDEAAYALLQKGRSLNQMREYRKALDCYALFQTKYKTSRYADDALVRAGVIYVGPLCDMKAGAKMYTLLLERYPDSNEADTAQYHLATLAYWTKDLAKAKSLYQQVAEKYPDGRYTGFINKKRLPEIMTAMSQSKPKSGTGSKS